MSDNGDQGLEVISKEQPRTSWLKRGWNALFLVVLLVLAAGIIGIYWLDSENGKGFVAGQIANYEFENGMKIRVERIEGSIYNDMTLKGVTISDTKGVFIRVPEAKISWQPFAYITNHIDIRSLNIPTLNWSRIPQFKLVPDNGEPLLPDIDIDIARLNIARINIAEAITGQRHLGTLSGRVKIADRRAQIFLDSRALVGEGIVGGDTLKLVLDAVPQSNKLNINMALNAPADGLLASFTNVAHPVSLTLGGKGDWKNWRGTFAAKLNQDSIASIGLTAKDGVFAAKGETFPALLMSADNGNLFAPVTRVDMVATMEERILDLDGRISSENFTLVAQGVADLGNSQFKDMALDFRLLKPSVLATNLAGRGLSGKALLNGAFGKPLINYNLLAARIAADDMALEGLALRGEARVDTDRIIIPINATLKRVSGLNAAAGGLLTNVRLNGQLAMANGRLLSDNLKISSDRINATAIVVADLNSGLYTGALKGRVNDYRIDSVGIFNITTDVDLKNERAGGFRLTGNIRARSTRIFSEATRDFLGGNSLIAANISYGTDGITRFSNLKVAAPLFRMNSGQGSYTPGGGIKFSGRGFSNQYGPMAFNASGTLGAPVVIVTAERPGMGIGIANVVATIKGNGRGYDVIARGDTDYGKFTADIDILSGTGPMIVDVTRGDFAGIGVRGRLTQALSGAFEGRLAGIGSGFDGTILLSSFDGKQRAIVNAIANNARLEGPANLAIGRAIIDADIILYDHPQVIADVQMSDMQVNNVNIAAGRAKIDYKGGSGTARLYAEGMSSVPFRIAANANLQPNLWRVAVKGRANSINFSTAKPARIIPGITGYELMPTTIDLSKGKIQIAGNYGSGIKLQSRLTDVDLRLFNPMYQGLGLGGTATGSLDFSQPSPQAFPSADARLTIDNFTRTSIASISKPVDISLIGRLLPEGGNMRAIARRRGAVIGRMHINLTPLPPGSGIWQDRLLAAPLGGGIRYNGPADALFSLAALPDQSMSGTIGVAADFSGRVQTPQLTGVVRANNLTYDNDTYGTKLTKMRVRGTFTNDQLDVTELTAVAGNGTVSGKGFISLSSDRGYPMQIDLDADNAKLANSDYIAADATGSLTIVNNANTPALISGSLRLPETRYKIVREGAAQVATLTGVRRKPALGRQKITGDANTIKSLPSKWRLDIKLIANDKVYVSGMGLESEWSADLRITGTSDAPKISGQIDVIRGTLGFAGRSFELEDGRLNFSGNDATNPAIRLTASSEIDGITTRVQVNGSGNNPRITFSSTPNLPQDEIMARILFGNSVGELSAIQAVQLAASLNGLRGGSGGLNPLGVLQSATGVDRLRLLGPDEQNGRGTAVAVGQYISNDIYVEIVTDARGYTASQIEISLTPVLSVLGQISSFGQSNLNVRYRKDY